MEQIKTKLSCNFLENIYWNNNNWINKIFNILALNCFYSFCKVLKSSLIISNKQMTQA